MLNVPVIEGTFALRGVIYDERRGGYIDNVPSTFTRSNNDPGSTGQLQYTPPGGKCANGQPAGTGRLLRTVPGRPGQQLQPGRPGPEPDNLRRHPRGGPVAGQ